MKIEDLIFFVKLFRKTIMTLVYRSSKQLIQRPLHELGPGSYDVIKNDKNQSKNCLKSAIFASSTNRDLFETKKLEKESEQSEKSKDNQRQNKKQLNQVNYYPENESATFMGKKSTDCNHVFNSKVRRFSEQTQRIKIEQKGKQTLLVEQFKKTLLEDMNKVKKGKLLKTKDKLQKQKMILEENHQFFPSIPNYNSSYGYRYDSDTSKWLANENPNAMLQLIDKQRENDKNNHSLGPGYYFYKNKQNNSKLQNKPLQDERLNTLVGSLLYPKTQTQSSAFNSIQQDQYKMKVRIRLLGKSQIPKTQQKLMKSHNFLSTQNLNTSPECKKQALILSQMMKKFDKFIPKQGKQSPSKYLQKMKDNRQRKIQEELSTKINSQVSALHFFSKSHRFETKNEQNMNKKVKKEENDSEQKLQMLQNSSVVVKSHNRKEPYSLGEQRFKEKFGMDRIGPGTYQTSKTHQNNKSSPCLNLKQERFSYQEKSDSPSPGDYKVSKDISKKQNSLRNAFSNYKIVKNQEIRGTFKPDDSMESMYQNWGRQMNYIAKLEHQTPFRQTQTEQQSSQGKIQRKPLTKIKKQLQQSLRLFQTIQNPMRQKEQQRSKEDCPKQTKIYPKIEKHLYEYKKIPHDYKKENIGPGQYETSKQMTKKTFNVTYT